MTAIGGSFTCRQKPWLSCDELKIPCLEKGQYRSRINLILYSLLRDSGVAKCFVIGHMNNLYETMLQRVNVETNQ
jgi:hypothetical protein